MIMVPSEGKIALAPPGTIDLCAPCAVAGRHVSIGTALDRHRLAHCDQCGANGVDRHIAIYDACRRRADA